ncbi:MAG: hypothetical protein CL927_01205, partial [Deltaproteobacteria bacterium]|nr:hypothetical protein [Deltaproteobacteria bacterium]
MTSQTAALTAKVAATLVVGKAAWFYLSDSGVFLLVSREDDPRGLRFKELLAEARSSDTMAGRAVHGMAAHRPGGFQFLAKVGFPAAMEVLARWTAEHIADHPALGVLRNASYVQLGPDKKPVCVVRAPDAWAAVPIPGSASNASSGTSSSSVTVERVDSSAAFAAAKAVREAIAQETLSALSDYGLAAWIYLASTSKPDEPVLVVVPKATDPGRTKFNELCRKANAAGAIRAGSVVSLARQRRGVLRLTTRIDAAEVVPRIAAWAAMYAKSDAIEALYDCEYRLIDAQNQEVRVEQCPELWDALRGSGAEPATRKPNPPLPLEPSHDPEALAVLDAKTVAVLGQGLQPLWMHVAEGHSEGQVVLLAAQQSADPAAAAFKASVTAARQAGARARGSLSVLAVPKEGRLVLSTKADVPGVVARIARWAEQHAVSTSIRTLFDVQYQLVDADGTPVRTDEAQTRWAALRAQHADEAIPYAQESLAALERGADNYWAYLARTLDPQRPIVVMVDRASDPDGEEFRRVCAQARRWGACTSDLVTGITMQRAQGLEVLGSTAAVDVIARLAQWASHHSEHPGVAALVDARYRATDAQDTVIQVEQNDPVWDAIRMQHHPDRVAPSATATLAALALRADQYWVYVDGTGAHIVAVSKVADPQGMAFRRARQAVVQGGDGGVSAVATRQGDTLQMVGQADVSNVVERLVRWT